MDERLRAEWTKQRICSTCARPFSLADHNTTASQHAARTLAAGQPLSPRPNELERCPACAGTLRAKSPTPPPAAATNVATSAATTTPRPAKPQMTDAEAIAAALAVEQELRGESMKPFYVNVRRMAFLVAVLSLLLFVMLMYLLGNTQNGRGSLFAWSVLFLLLFGGSLGTSFWGHRQLQRLSHDSGSDPFTTRP